MTLQISANSAFSSPIANMDNKSGPQKSPALGERCVRCNRLTDRCSCSPESRQQSPPQRKGLAFSVDSLLGNVTKTSNPPPETSTTVTPSPKPTSSFISTHQEEDEEDEEINVNDIDELDHLSDHTSGRDSASPRSLTPETSTSPPQSNHGPYPLGPGVPDHGRLGLPGGGGHIPPHPFLAAEAAKWSGIGGVSLSWLPGFTTSPREYLCFSTPYTFQYVILSLVLYALQWRPCWSLWHNINEKRYLAFQTHTHWNYSI